MKRKSKRKSSKRRNPNTQAAKALARWESEGGALKPASERVREQRAALAEGEELVLRCLGAAVLLQWNELPTKIQRSLFEYAVSAGDPRDMAQLKGQIARFLHKHKSAE